MDGWRAGRSLLLQDKGIKGDEKRSGMEEEVEEQVASAVGSCTVGTFSRRRGGWVGLGSVCLKKVEHQ